MSSSSAQIHPNGHTAHDEHDHVLRPRPRKPQHSQVSQLSRTSTDGAEGEALTPMTDSLGPSSGQNRYVVPSPVQLPVGLFTDAR